MAKKREDEYNYYTEIQSIIPIMVSQLKCLAS